MLPSTPERIGKYRVKRLIGRGGMGAVWLAEDPDLGREVAVKVLAGERLRQGGAATRFAHEARALGSLHDRHIVQIHEYVPGDEPYLVMEFVRGRSLSRLLLDRGPRPPSELVEAARQTLAGLRAAHAAGILHRDIKPGNILLGDDGVYRLLDFGLARRIGEETDLTRTGEVVGTARYLAPELARGGEAGPASDLYALGVTLLELAAGANPRNTEANPLRMLRQIADEPLPPVRSLLPSLPERLAAWLDRLVAHDPTQRYPSAGEALAALEATTGTTVTADRLAPTGIMPSGSAGARQGTTTRISATHRPTPPEPLPAAGGRRQALFAVLAPRRLGLLLKLTLAIWLVSGGSTLLCAWVIIRSAEADSLQRLRAELRNAAAAAACLIDGEQHAALVAAPSRDHPAFERVRSSLRAFRATRDDISNIYTAARLPDTDATGVVQFICDEAVAKDENGNGIIDPNEESADPGQAFDAKPCPAMLEGFKHPAVDEAPTTDQWGVWLSGYAPIRDRSGAISGLVGIDLSAAHVQGLLGRFLRQAWLVLAGSLVLALALAVFIALRLRRPVEALRRGMLALARGDKEVAVAVRSGDEFQGLAIAFNQMAAELQEAAQVRNAFDRVMVRAMTEQISGSTSAETSAGCAALLHAELDVRDAEQRKRLAEQLPALLPRLVDAVRRHGGSPERVAGCGLLAIFPAVGDEAAPQGRAITAALAMLAAAAQGGVRLRIGIAADAPAQLAEERAALLCRANLAHGTDLLVEAQAFAPVAGRYFADHFADAAVDCYAVKGEAAPSSGG